MQQAGSTVQSRVCTVSADGRYQSEKHTSVCWAQNGDRGCSPDVFPAAGVRGSVDWFLVKALAVNGVRCWWKSRRSVLEQGRPGCAWLPGEVRGSIKWLVWSAGEFGLGKSMGHSVMKRRGLVPGSSNCLNWAARGSLKPETPTDDDARAVLALRNNKVFPVSPVPISTRSASLFVCHRQLRLLSFHQS